MRRYIYVARVYFNPCSPAYTIPTFKCTIPQAAVTQVRLMVDVSALPCNGSRTNLH